MKQTRIKTISTRILNQKLIVKIGLETNEFIYLNSTNVRQNTFLNANELELLIGSSLRVDFYKSGEKMFNEEICMKDNTIIREYFFELQKPIERLRTENSYLLLPFQKILSIGFFEKFNRENVRIKTDSEQVIYMSLKAFSNECKLPKSLQGSLIGSFICPEYCIKGQLLPNGNKIRTDNLIKTLNLRYHDNVETMYESYIEDIKEAQNYEIYKKEIADMYPMKKDYIPHNYGYKNWDEMTLHTVYEGNHFLWSNDEC